MATKGKHRVLVVDDEPSVLFTYRMLLEEQGYEVIAALSSEEASTALAEKPFDLVLCDLSLERDRTGFEVIETARKRSPAVSCVLLTGYANKEVADRAQAGRIAKQPGRGLVTEWLRGLVLDPRLAQPLDDRGRRIGLQLELGGQQHRLVEVAPAGLEVQIIAVAHLHLATRIEHLDLHR